MCRDSYNNNVGKPHQTTSNGNANQPTGQNNQMSVGPFCFHCERNGADFNHKSNFK